MSRAYSLSTEKIEGLIEDFCKSHNLSHNIETMQTPLGLKVSFDGKKKSKPGILKIFFPSGLVSFQIQGDKTLKNICEECRDFLINNASIPANNIKCLSVSNVTDETVEVLIGAIKDQENIKVSDLLSTPQNLRKSWKIEGPYNSHIRINHFNTETLTVQGPVTSLFFKVSTMIIELSQENSSDIVKELFSLSNQQPEVISVNIEDHIDAAESIKGLLIESWIKASLVLINTPVELEDYSCCAFPILRALDAVMTSFLIEEGGEFKDYGDFFEYNKNESKFVLKSGCDLFSSQSLRNTIEDAYTFYNCNRHPLFHVDKDNVETSKLLDFAEALNVIKEALVIVNRLYNNHK